jgi:hypothetical protein
MAFPIVTPAEQIGQLYVGYFGRAADPAGLAYWVDRLNDGMSLVAIANSFAVQPEATSLYAYLAAPLVGDPQTFIAAIYNDLFNRNPDAAGLAYWADQLTVHGTPPGQMVLDVISGAQGADRTTIENKTHVAVGYAQAFHSMADAHAVVAPVGADPATVPAITVTTFQAGFETGLMTNPGPGGTPWVGTFHSNDIHTATDTLLVNPTALTLNDIPTFAGAAVDYGQALALLAGGGGAHPQAVYQADVGALWIDADNNGLLNALDLKVAVDLAGIYFDVGANIFDSLPGLLNVLQAKLEI